MSHDPFTAGAPAAMVYRAPRWWTTAGAALLAVAGIGIAPLEASVPFVAVSAAIGCVTVFVARRSWVQVDAEGVTLRPNGLGVVRAPWSSITSVVGHRILLDDGRRVTVPPLAGDPLAHVQAVLAHRHRAS